MVLNELYNITGEWVDNILQINVPANSGIKEIHFPLNCTQWITGATNHWQLAYFNLDTIPNAFFETVNMYHVFMMPYAKRPSSIKGSPQTGPNVIDMNGAYCWENYLTGSPVCGEKVINLYDTYNWCQNLTGGPVCGSNVVIMDGAYYNCSRLTGNPVCGNNVINMSNTYKMCWQLKGNPACGPNVKFMDNAYYYCTDLTGNPNIGPNVVNMVNSYCQCCNLTGNVVIPESVGNMSMAFCDCTNLAGNAFIYNTKFTSKLQCNYTFTRTKITNVYTRSAQTAYYVKAGWGGQSFTEDTANNRYYNSTNGVSIYWNWNGVVW